MHTTDSDGNATHDELAGFAISAGLDYVLVTDHMTLKSKSKHERFHGSLAMIIGYEHNDPADKHHYLLFETPQVYDRRMSAKEYVATGATDNALGIIAHPDEVRSETGEYPPYQWIDWSVQGFSGIEIWNHMSEWMERLAEANIFGKLVLLFSPRKFFTKPPSATLKRWDQYNQESNQRNAKPILGVAGPDAHAFHYQLGPKRVIIFPYKVHFLTLQTHLLLNEPFSEDYSVARGQILDALRACRVYFSNQRWGDAAGFTFTASYSANSTNSENSENSADLAVFVAGDTICIANSQKVTFKIETPSSGVIRLIGNGELIGSQAGKSAEFEVGAPGVYRAEVWKSGKGWIYANHIRLRAATDS